MGAAEGEREKEVGEERQSDTRQQLSFITSEHPVDTIPAQSSRTTTTNANAKTTAKTNKQTAQ